MTKQLTQRDGQWAADFFAAAQLAVRGYRVTVPAAAATGSSLAVVSPAGSAFTVQVVGIARENGSWVVKRGATPAAYLAVLAVPSPGRPRYFVLTPDEVAEALKKVAPPRRNALGTFQARDVIEHEDRWEKLPP